MCVYFLCGKILGLWDFWEIYIYDYIYMYIYIYILVFLWENSRILGFLSRDQFLGRGLINRDHLMIFTWITLIFQPWACITYIYIYHDYKTLMTIINHYHFTIKPPVVNYQKWILITILTINYQHWYFLPFVFWLQLTITFSYYVLLYKV